MRMRRKTVPRVVLRTERIRDQAPPSDKTLHPRTEIFSSADLVPSEVKLLMNFLMTPRVSWPCLVRRSRLLCWRPITVSCHLPELSRVLLMCSGLTVSLFPFSPHHLHHCCVATSPHLTSPQCGEMESSPRLLPQMSSSTSSRQCCKMTPGQVRRAGGTPDGCSAVAGPARTRLDQAGSQADCC